MVAAQLKKLRVTDLKNGNKKGKSGIHTVCFKVYSLVKVSPTWRLNA